MFIGKYLSLEEVRRDPKLLKRFIKQREIAEHGVGDLDCLEATLMAMVKSQPLEPGTSPLARDESSSGIQIRRGT